MQMSETINELAAALAKAQATIKPAAKDSVNPHFKSKYADLGAVWDACRKPLTDNGLSVVQLPTDAGEGRVGLTSMLIHSSGQFISCMYSTKLRQDDAQSVGSALTYLRRYGLASLIGIVADEDDDGNSTSRPQNGASASYRADTTTPLATNGNGRITEPQMKALFGIWKNAGFGGDLREWVKESYGCKVDELTKAQASAAIETLKGDTVAAN